MAALEGNADTIMYRAAKANGAKQPVVAVVAVRDNIGSQSAKALMARVGGEL